MILNRIIFIYGIAFDGFGNHIFLHQSQIFPIKKLWHALSVQNNTYDSPRQGPPGGYTYKNIYRRNVTKIEKKIKLIKSDIYYFVWKKFGHKHVKIKSINSDMYHLVWKKFGHKHAGPAGRLHVWKTFVEGTFLKFTKNLED